MKQGLILKSGAGSGIALPQGAETIGAAVAGISTDGPGVAIQLEAVVDVTTGTGTTALTVQIRRGATTAGPVVGAAEVPAAGASARVSVPIQQVDQPGEVAGQVYIVTVSPTGATGAGTINQASIFAAY